MSELETLRQELESLKERLEAHEKLLMVAGCGLPVVRGYNGPGGHELLAQLLREPGLSPGVISAVQSVLKKLDKISK